jgi:hypothetical protein
VKKTNSSAIKEFCKAYGIDPNSAIGFKCEGGMVTFTIVPTLVENDSRESYAIKEGEVPLTKEMLDEGVHKSSEYIRRIDDGTMVVKF